jgi:hypothetical protein
MFAGMKRRWRRETRADVARKEVEDALSRFYTRADGYQRYEFTSAFEYMKNDLETEHGQIAVWPDETKKVLDAELMTAAREGVGTSLWGATGLGLLSLYLEAHTLPIDHAKQILSSIECWYGEALRNDIRQGQERLMAKLRHLQPHLAGLSLQVALVVASTGIASARAALVTLGVAQPIRLRIQKRVQGLLHDAPHHPVEVVLDPLIVDRDDVAQRTRCSLGHGGSFSAHLVAFSHLQVSQIRSRQPYLFVRKILYVIGGKCQY